jgi:hypothetical protein
MSLNRFSGITEPAGPSSDVPAHGPSSVPSTASWHILLPKANFMLDLGLSQRWFLRYNAACPLKVNRRFGRKCRLHLQCRRISQARNQRKAGSKRSQNFMLI